MANTDIKIGDSVYWKQRIGRYIYTISGIVTAIDKDIATIMQSKNTYGKVVNKHVNTLTKSKVQ